MQGVDFQSEVFLIAESVGLPLERLDLVVHSFQRTSGDRSVVPGQDAVSVTLKSFGKRLQKADAAGPSADAPAIQKSFRYCPDRLFPELPQVLFEIIGGGQRPVELERLVQSLVFVSLLIKVFRIFQQQPAGSLQNVFV